MKIKPMMRYNFIPIKMAIINKTGNNVKVWRRWKLSIAGRNVRPLWKNTLAVSQKVKQFHSYVDSAIPFICVYLSVHLCVCMRPREMEILKHMPLAQKSKLKEYPAVSVAAGSAAIPGKPGDPARHTTTCMGCSNASSPATTFWA